MKTFPTLTIASLTILALGFTMTVENANAGGWVSKATGGRVTTPDPIRRIAPNGISYSSRGTASELGAWSSTTYSINLHGYVTETTSGNMNSSKNLGRIATLKHTAWGDAYWTYGGKQADAAAQYDRNQVYKIVIDPNSGRVTKDRYSGNRYVSSTYAGQATLIQSNGRAIYSFQGKSVYANRPSRSAYPATQQYVPRNPQQFGNSSQDPGAALAIGILGAIGQALNNQQQ
ncbi:hypothetical protein [Neorhodopirellula lusitana]|uniref:hypothetical protein n=1 Tax=Neorhodopirellula lusitana TaxID=445327 RepID=UPI00384C1185